MNGHISENVLAAALAYGQAGFPVLPTGRDKRPLVKNWPQVASVEDKQIAAWFDKSQPPNIGLVTGQRSGFFCLDVDAPAGLVSLDELEKRHGALPRQVAALTPSGGLHLYFHMPPDFDPRNSTGKLGTGLDIRAGGGYVLAPPSEAVGHHGRLGKYEWAGAGGILASPPPKAPAWLLDLLRRAPSPSMPVFNAPTKGAYGTKALAEECRLVTEAAPGTRNDTLNRASFVLFQLAAGGALEGPEVETALTQAALANGLSLQEIQTTLQSARIKAMAHPRSALETARVAPRQQRMRTSFIPQPLPPPPLEVFPPKIQKLLIEAAVAFKRLPLEVPIVALLALLSASLGQSRVLRIKDNWEEAGNLYLALVAGSGLGKSPCFKEFLKPLWKAEARDKASWEAAMDGYNALLEEHNKNKEVLTPLPSKPIRAQYLIEDATTEAIGGILAENPRGLLWYGDELSSIILNLDRYSTSKGGTKARLLSTYDRSPWKTSRRDKEKDQVILSAALSIVGTVQPRVLKEIFGQGDALSGFLPRFIFILARRGEPPLLTDEIFTGQEILEKISGHLLAWQMEKDDEQYRPRQIKMSPAAYALYEEWHNQTVSAAWRESETDNAIAAKLVTQVLRLALLLHSLKAALEESDGLSELNEESMSAAIALGRWIQAHQRQVWLALDIEDESRATPLEVAIIQATIELEGFLEEHDWRVANDDFNRLVMEKAGQAIDPAQIGKASARLGLKPILIGKQRGKEISRELLKEFKLGFYLSSCRSEG